MLQILIATTGPAPHLKGTLASLAQAEIPVGGAKVWVVENGPKSDIEAICASDFGNLVVQYRYTPVRGKSNALNFVIEHLHDRDLLVMTDDDAELSTRSLVAYQEAATRNPTNHFFGGPFSADYEEQPLPWVVPYLPPSAKGWVPSTSSFDPRRDKFIGFNWAAFAGDIKRLGGFDNRFGPGSTTGGTGQEYDMQRRMHAAGMLGVLVPEASALHHVPANRCSPEWVLERARKNGVSRGINTATRPPTTRLLVSCASGLRLVTSKVVAAATRSVPQKKTSFRAQIVEQKMAGYFQGVQRRAG